MRCLLLILVLFSVLNLWGRSPQQRKRFMRMTGYPHGRPGYVVDHIVPLRCNGEDAPANMQWQTIAEGKKKDRWERNCSLSHSRAGEAIKRRKQEYGF